MPADPSVQIESWHKEEYKLLSAHYFHEDNYFLKSMTVYATLNSALLAVGSSKFILEESFGVKFGIPIFGMVCCVAWLISLIRVRFLRRAIENRIEEIEIQYSSSEKNSSLRLGIRKRDKPAGLARIPVSLVMRLFPLTFLFIWAVVLIR